MCVHKLHIYIICFSRVTLLFPDVLLANVGQEFYAQAMGCCGIIYRTTLYVELRTPCTFSYVAEAFRSAGVVHPFRHVRQWSRLTSRHCSACHDD